MPGGESPTTCGSRAVLIIAGNSLRGDDGAAHAALALLAPSLPAGVTVWDSPSCLDVVPDVLGARGVVVADTVLTGGRPGDIASMTIGPADPLPLPGSLHDCGPLAALAIARQLGWQGSATLVGIEPLTLDGEGLSRPVHAAIPAFAIAIRRSLVGALERAKAVAVSALE